MAVFTEEEVDRLDFLHKALREGTYPPFVLVDFAEEARGLWQKRAKALMIQAETDWRTPVGRWRTLPHEQMVSTVQQETRAWGKFVSQLGINRKRWGWDPVGTVAKYVSDHVAEGSVSDFGCGDAGLARHLAKSRPDLTVRSFDLNAIDDSVEVCDVAETPLESETQAAVVMSCSLWGDRLRMLAEAKRVLADRGVLVVAEPESHWEPGELAALVQRAGFAVTSEVVDKDQRFTHILCVKVGSL